jgi:hypothetical protein
MGSNFIEALVLCLVVCAVLFIIFLIFRELVCWYWKINRAIVLLESINGHLERLSKISRSLSASTKISISGIDKLSTEERELIKSIYGRLPKMDESAKQEILAKFRDKIMKKLNIDGTENPEDAIRELVNMI